MLGGIVRGRSVALRVPREDDLASFARWAADMRVRRTSPHAYWDEPAMPATWKERLAKQSESKDSILWAIDAGGQLAGACGIELSGAPIADSVGMTHFTIDPDRWRQGLGWDAALALHRWVFDIVHLRRATAVIAADNAAALHVAERLGYRRYAEGHAAYYRDGAYVDQVRLMMDVDDWTQRWDATEREYPVPLGEELEQ
ncbi:hypothetical protein BH18CHL2_BH18CHL2_07480 [soil metagenome]